MKKIFILASILTLTLSLCGCDEMIDTYIKIEKNYSKTTELVYNINNTGNINQTASINMRNIIETLTNDLESLPDTRFGYTLTDLTIQSISFDLKKNPDNSAFGMNIGSFVVLPANSKTPLFRERNIPVNDVTMFAASAFLDEDGLAKINAELKGFIKKTSGRSTMTVNIAGVSQPASAKVSAQLELTIRFNIEYWYCEQTIPFLMSPDSECD
jgi:hypothetical protein